MLPAQYLAKFSSRYPSIWRAVDEMRVGPMALFCPRWCFLPSAGASLLIGYHAGASPSPDRPDLIQDTNELSMLAAWRVSQGVYRFEPELFAALIDTPDTGNLPVEVLWRLPEWAVFVETPNTTVCDKSVSGFFARLDSVDREPSLCVLWLPVAVEDEPISMLLHAQDGETLTQALDRTFRVAETLVANDLRSAFDQCLEALRLAVPLILYLCSTGPEVAEHTGGQWTPGNNPAPVKTKKGWRLFPPDSPTIWRVGETIARQIRAASDAERGTHSGPRPHIRRAHWHGFWSGTVKPREGVEPTPRKFDLKWLPPIAVALEDE